MYSAELLTQTVISGLMIGVLYALMALGITFIYSIVRMINWAMGEFYMLGSYIQYLVVAYALAGLAGALLAPLFLVYPTNGVVTTVKGFEIIVIGGLGSIPGALIGGLLLGLVESLGAAFISSPYQNAYGFVLVLLVLMVRPYG